ncbi:hypothetical protein K9M59_02765 [Candidatus Gracilibacteria bacterium]|nr:hypothetical protein [Candidatus Gracilibacteria bacterium]MCF7819253.1 hypothetical protein [Candidatus Gracilibacteria bacterium]
MRETKHTGLKVFGFVAILALIIWYFFALPNNENINPAVDSTVPPYLDTLKTPPY